MDSVTQAVLGASVAQAVMGKRVGRLAPIWGAALGTLPDLDVLIPFGGVVEDFTYHRGFSHSLLVQAALAPLLAYLASRLHPNTRAHWKQWWILALAVLWTHSLLDALTVYGTQLLWPLTEHPFGLSSVFIIDPFYTVPLMVALFLAGRRGWQSAGAHRATAWGLALSSLYLVWGIGAKLWVEQHLQPELAAKGLSVDKVLSTPAPFNTVLWRVLVREEGRYHEIWYALWEDPAQIRVETFTSDDPSLEALTGQWDVERLIWFTKGFYRAAIRDGELVISDLRMGLEGSYVFNFAVARQFESGHLEPIRARRLSDPRDMGRLALLWKRFSDPTVSLSPLAPGTEKRTSAGPFSADGCAPTC